MRCQICNNDSVTKERGYINSYWPDVTAFNERTIVHCSACGSGFIDRDFSAEFLDDFYSHHYRAKNSTHYIDFARMTGKNASARSLSQLELAARFVSLSAGDCFVDVGPGGGHSFVAAQKSFPGVRKVAIELTEGAPEIYKRLYDAETYRNASEFLSKGLRAKLVLVSHCLEHVNPSALKNFVDELKSMLVPGGIVLIEVPHADVVLQRRYYVQDAPHCVFFSQESLRKLFLSNGWDVLFAGTAGPRMSMRFNWRTDGSFFPKVRAKAVNFTKRIFQGATRRWERLARRIGWAKEPNFRYGGERLVLRLVATPSKNLHG